MKIEQNSSVIVKFNAILAVLMIYAIRRRLFNCTDMEIMHFILDKILKILTYYTPFYHSSLQSYLICFFRPPPYGKWFCTLKVFCEEFSKKIRIKINISIGADFSFRVPGHNWTDCVRLTWPILWPFGHYILKYRYT